MTLQPPKWSIARVRMAVKQYFRLRRVAKAHVNILQQVSKGRRLSKAEVSLLREVYQMQEDIYDLLRPSWFPNPPKDPLQGLDF